MIIASLYWLVMLAPKSLPPRITARIKPMIFQTYNDMNNDIKILNVPHH